MKIFLRAVVLGLLLMVGLAANIEAQGPFSAQIQVAIRALKAGSNTWGGTQTFNNVVISGTCTGCGAPGGANTQVQFNNAGAFGGDADLTFSGDTLDVTKARFGTTFETPSDTGAQVGIYAPVTASWFIRDTTNNVEFGAYTSGGASAIGTATNNGWSLYSNNTNRWTVQAAGHLVATADNTYDIGASAATRPRNIYVATALLTGTYIGWDGGSQFRSPSDGIVSVRNSANSVYGSIIARHQPTDHTGDGAITIAPGVAHISKGSAAALTLADPAASDEGTVIIITAETAFAHTVSNAAGSGFNAGGAASDVATFGGAIGDSIVIIAINGKWNVLSLRNVTLG